MRRTSPPVLYMLAVFLVASSAIAAVVTVFGPQTYTRGPGRPVDVTRTFTVSKPKGQYTLRVINHGVTSAEIVLNGKTIFDRDDFTRRDRDRDRWEDWLWDRAHWGRDDWDRWDRDDPDRRDRDGDDRDRDRRRPVRRLEEQVKLKDGSNKIVVTVRSRRGTSFSVDIIGESSTNTDTTPPTISATASPAPNANGWNKTSVTVTFTCADNSGAVASCNAPITVSADTPAQIVSGTATDQAGNTASTSVTVQIDHAAPIVTAARSPAPNADGWNNTPVTVTFTCSDVGSAIATCPAPVVVSADATSHVVSGTATDRAGNGASAQVTVNLDQTAPTLALNLTPSYRGWITDPVTARFTCDDERSGITACPPQQVIGSEGAGHVVTATVVDRAGNSAAISSAPFSIDATPPLIEVSFSTPANAAGWHHQPVTLHFTCSDNGSGIESCPADRVITSEGPEQAFGGIAMDNAGNSASATVLVNLDLTPPELSLSAPDDGTSLFVSSVDAAGIATDALSGLAGVNCNGVAAAILDDRVTCAAPLTLGQNAVTIAARDVAGNVTTVVRNVGYTRVPVVTMTAPQANSFLNISPTTVTGTVDEPDATVLINSVPAPVSNGQFSVALPIAEGPNIITATATATTGAIGSASLEVNLDTTPPHVTITSPPNGFVTADSAITVAGNVNDIVVGTVNDQQAQVKVNAVDAQVANRTFLAPGVPLAPGPNVIQAVGRDRTGNAVTTEITVIRQAATAPHIRLISGNNQSAPSGSPLAAPLVVEIADAAGGPVPNTQVIFKVVHNDGRISTGSAAASIALATTDGQGRAQAQWTLGQHAGAGGNCVEAYSVGLEGTALFTATGTPGPAGLIVVDAGNDQIGAVGQTAPRPFVAVVVDAGHNRLGGVPVTFSVRDGGGGFAGEPSVMVTSDSDGRVSATLTLGPEEGNANNIVDATFESNAGLPATFTASGREAGSPAATSISGVVLDNSNVPIPGVIVRAVLTSDLRSGVAAVHAAVAAQTDAHGQFLIPGAPVGLVKVMVDGTTAERPGHYPALEYDIVTVAGQAHTVGQPIYLLPIDTENKLCVTATSGGGTLQVPSAPGFSLSFGPGQVTFPGGDKSGCISVTVVHGDKVPMVPSFGQQPRFIVTIQPPGAHFEPPAPLSVPNVDGLPPRAVTEMYSYDHDISAFVAIGTGTVSADGLVVKSNPGVGVLKSGWHAAGPPSPPGNASSPPKLSASLRASRAEAPSGAIVKMIASGSGAKSGVFPHWEVVDDPNDPNDDPTIGKFITKPECIGKGSCEAELQGIGDGVVSVYVVYGDLPTQESVNSSIVKVRFKFKLTLNKLRTLDDIKIFIDKRNGVDEVDDDEVVWEFGKTEQDLKPIAYVQGRKMKVDVELKLTEKLEADLPKVVIEGVVPGLGKFRKEDVTIPRGKDEFRLVLEIDTAFPAARTKYYPSFEIEWNYMMAGKTCPADCVKAGSTANPLYVTLTTPIASPKRKENEVYLTPLHIAVSTDGATTAQQAFRNTWATFESLTITTWGSPWRQPQPLYYYQTGMKSSMCPITIQGLLTSKVDEGPNQGEDSKWSGQCGTLAQVMVAALAVNGIVAGLLEVLPDDASHFLVDKWETPTAGADGHGEYRWIFKGGTTPIENSDDLMVRDPPSDIYGDLKSLPGNPGQNSPTPSQKIFIRHWVVVVDPTVTGTPNTFDPSYGVVIPGITEAAAAAAFQANWIYGFGRSAGMPPWSMRVRKKASGTQQIKFGK